jgi:hypothetical protein
VNIVVSPYHLTTREPPAMASLLLADTVITLLPASLEDSSAAAAKRIAERSPWYSRFMESWSWTMPLWEEGVLSSTCENDDIAAEMRGVAQRLRDDEHYLPLRPLMREQLYESDHTYLSCLGADLLKGGPDPGITVPLSAGLDRFARRHSCLVARAQPVSVVQRAEASFAHTLFAVALPVFIQASAEHLLLARELLEPQLARLRQHLDRAANSADASAPTAADLAALASDYAKAFDAHADDLRGDADDEVRAVVGSVVITGVSMPADVVLKSSLVAVEKLAGVSPSRSRADTTTLPVRADDAGSVVSLIIKPMGSPSRRR